MSSTDSKQTHLPQAAMHFTLAYTVNLPLPAFDMAVQARNLIVVFVQCSLQSEIATRHAVVFCTVQETDSPAKGWSYRSSAETVALAGSCTPGNIRPGAIGMGCIGRIPLLARNRVTGLVFLMHFWHAQAELSQLWQCGERVTGHAGIACVRRGPGW